MGGLSRVVIKQGPGGRGTRPGRTTILPPGTSLVGKPTWQRPPDTIRGISLNGLWSPGQPTNPISPAGTEPRGWQFLNFQNMIFTPRATEDYTFDDLRTLSRFPMVRALIEARKDQLANLPWQIRVKPKANETNAARLAREQGDSVIQKLTAFFERPSPDCDYADFTAMWADEMLVHDAPCVLVRRTRAGDLGELRVIDGAMVVKYVDANGWTPQDGSPAYAQLWWGMPAWNLTTDELVYRPRCPRAHKLYGLSKNEIAAQYTELAWKRLEMMTRHYTDGMVPDAIQMVPSGVTPKTVAQQQEYLRSQLAGNLARLSGLMLMQGFTKDGTDKLYFPKNELMVDTSIDDILTRILCFIFGVSQQRLQRQMNRASAESSQEASEEEGLEPDKKYFLRKYNYIIQTIMGYQDHEFVYQDVRERDIEKQMTVDVGYTGAGIRTINDIRKGLGDDPSTQKDSLGRNVCDLLMVKTNLGMVPVGDLAVPGGTEAYPEPAEPIAPEPTAPGKTPGKKKPATAAPSGPADNAKPRGRKKRGEDLLPVKESGKCLEHNEFDKNCGACREEALEKILSEHMEKSRQAFQLVIDPHHFTPQSEQSRYRIQAKMERHLKKCATAVAARAVRVMGKADDNDELIKQIIDDDEFWTSLWAELPNDLVPDLEDATLAGMTKSVVEAQLHITEQGVINEFNAVAQSWAAQHSAAMIGMRRDAKGSLVPNPNTEYNISETTRDAVRKIIVDAFAKDTRMSAVESAIMDAGTFSADRAANIARTEVQMAQVQGNVAVWQKMGLVQTARWQTSNLPGVCDDCADNAAAGEVEFGKPYPSGDLWPPAHPGGCRCTLVSVKLGRSEQAA
jgi:Phage portal protein